jgi:hypothetical protein
MPGLHDLCELLDSTGVPRGLITRNVKSSIEYFHANHFSARARFEPAISRECAFPYKPSPAALLHICEQWGVPPGECLMVGDSAKVRGRGPLERQVGAAAAGPPRNGTTEPADGSAGARYRRHRARPAPVRPHQTSRHLAPRRPAPPRPLPRRLRCRAPRTTSSAATARAR